MLLYFFLLPRSLGLTTWPAFFNDIWWFHTCSLLSKIINPNALLIGVKACDKVFCSNLFLCIVFFWNLFPTTSTSQSIWHDVSCHWTQCIVAFWIQHMQIDRHSNLVCMQWFCSSATWRLHNSVMCKLESPKPIRLFDKIYQCTFQYLALCKSHLGTLSPVKCIFSFSLKLIVIAVKLVSPLTSSFVLLVVFWPQNL